MNATVCILILNYNGKDLLARYIPQFRKAAERSRHNCRVAVVDNKSTDDSVSFVRSAFSDVTVYEAKENRVLCSYNEVACGIEDDIVIFMNNDIGVEEDFVDPLVGPFLGDRDVFFVTPKCFGADRKTYEGNRTASRIRYGVFWSTALYPGYERWIDRPGPTSHGGFGAFDRRKFAQLGGYDDLYLPGRLEDADICFRARRRGWKCLYEPKSVVYHEGGTSFHKAFGVQKTMTINWRNTFLFMAKNLKDPLTPVEFLLWLPVQLAFSLLRGRPEFAVGLWQALPKLGQALAKRKALKEGGCFEGPSDRSLFEMGRRGDGA